MKKKLVIILALFIFVEANAQSEDLTPQNEHTLSLNVPVQIFWKNNEYKRKIAYGYTLGGFRLIPNLEYRLNKNVSFSFGANMLRYWGADEYGRNNFISVPYYTDTNTQKLLHIKPYFRFDWQINNNLNFVMGNIKTENSHYLPIPLYNREFAYSSDGEEGLQLIYKGKYWTNDAWLNWQNFNFYNDVERESFDLGTSGSLSTAGNFPIGLQLDYSFIWHHNGGELDTITTLDLDHWANGHFGMNFHIDNVFNNSDALTFSLNYLYSKDMKNSTLPFKSGHAWFPTINYSSATWNATLGYYDSKGMITFYGTNFFSNIAQRDKTITYPKNQILYANIQYDIMIAKDMQVSKSDYILSIVGEFFYKLDDKNSIEKEIKGLSFGTGLILTAKPKFQLYRFKKLN